MIIVRLMGGLGNQMFQYAIARRLAQANVAEVKFDAGWFENIPASATARKYELGAFGIACDVATPGELRAARGFEIPPHFPRLLKRGLKAIGRGERDGWIREKHFHFDPAILGLRGDVYLDGYWQSEKYFADIAETLRGEFTLKREPDGVNRRLLEEIGACEAVSLHVRRGDYVTNKGIGEVHGALPLAYYRAAVARIADSTIDPKFYVFSDDPDWVKDNLKISGSTTYVDHNGPADACEDLRLMSACRHHVVANSSFSWWGAWLDNKAGKQVVAPHKWFASEAIDISDLIPAAWQIV